MKTLGIKKSINLKINIKDLAGFMIGPTSETFTAVRKADEQIDEDVETWKYISIYTKENLTYDFRISNRQEAIAFIVAVSECARIINPEFFSITNKRLISQIMLRKKLQKTANA